MQSHGNSLARIESDWTVYLNHFLTWKWRHGDTETSFDFTSVDFYLFLYNETFTFKYNDLFESFSVRFCYCSVFIQSERKNC